MTRPSTGRLVRSAIVAAALVGTPAVAQNQVYFGAVHVHTNYSFDAYTNGTVTTPDDAYAWAKGKAISSGDGQPEMKITTPLDFYAVSDHAEWMGVFRLMEDPQSPMSKHPMAPRITSEDQNTAMQAFAEILREFSLGKPDPALTNPEISNTVWKDIVATADAHYAPGEFTTFPAFEWSSNPEMRNLHRVVVFRDSTHVPDVPFSSLDSLDPEDLWAWMAAQREDGATLLAIPHNANASDGLMFSLNTLSGEPLGDAYIEQRRLNEPLYEITQIKGSSETHPDLSPNDEFAGFELWDYTLSADALRPEHRAGSYARQALLDGLSFSTDKRGNPFQFGFIGDTDTHNAAASHEEFNYTGKFAFEIDPRHRLQGLDGQPEGQKQQVREFSSGGIAAVWAEANTREAIYDAMLRRETYGTSGPMIKLRFFGGWDFAPADAAAVDMAARGYARGVPMGGELSAGKDKTPHFIVWAAKDANSGNLDRVQIVKGWVDSEGRQQERVFDVAWSGDRKPGDDGRLPAVGNTVDIDKATYSNDIGAPQLSAVWQDPAFDPA